MPLNVKLVVVGGDVKTAEIKLRLPSTIGRGRGTTIVLPHPLVSRQHCELYESGEQLMVRDLGSLNGTFVNNQRITEAPLAPGELLTVGTVTFRAVYESDEVESKQAPTLKGTGDKTVQAPKAAALAGSPKKSATEKPPEEDSGPLEFNFDQPLMPVDQEGRPTARAGATDVTERLDATIASKPTQPGKGKSAAAAKKSTEKSAAPPKEEQKKKRASAEEEEEKVDSSTDDDLNDFLDSLGTK